MKISERWLGEMVGLPADGAELADDLTMLGLEVDGIAAIGDGLDRVVAGRVQEVVPHPSADRLQLCRVDIGQEEALTIVCGAPDVRVGKLYPVALPGARLPGGREISVSSVRGVHSAGMLCSAAELGLGEEGASGLLALDEGEPGNAVSELLGLPDRVIDLNLTPNRADCFSVLGIARELGARYRRPVMQPDDTPAVTMLAEVLPVEVADTGSCRHFAGRVVRGLDTSVPTPLWMRERLRRAGLRPIQLIVDVTNYTMLELGQPLHAYDLEQLQGGIRVRQAAPGEALVLLGGQALTLRGNELLITDDRGPIGLAGIMGGAATAVHEGSSAIFLESAHFVPESISGRARQHGLQTDASMRFERGVDPALPRLALERATRLLVELAGGAAGPAIDCAAPAEPGAPRAAVALRRERLAAVLGLGLPDGAVSEYLRALGMLVQERPEGWQVVPPSWRFDLALEADLIEEVARLHGYDRLPAVPGVQSVRLGSVPDHEIGPDRLRTVMIDRGYQEIITYSFIRPEEDRLFALDDAPIRLENPISAEMAHMRRSLWPGLLQTLLHNAARQLLRVRLFECGRKFCLQDTEIKEIDIVSGVAWGSALPEQWGVVSGPVDFFDLKADVEALLALGAGPDDWSFEPATHPALHPGRSARILRRGQPAGWLGELHPVSVDRLGLNGSPMLFELELTALQRQAALQLRPVSRFPATRRDLAVLVARDLPVGELVTAVRAAAGATLIDVVVFDVYTGPNIDSSQKSVALGLILQETSRTLTDQEVMETMDRTVAALRHRFNAKTRE